MYQPLVNKVKKTRIFKPQPIKQIASGVVTNGTVSGTGGFESIQSFGHDLSNLGKRDCGGPMILQREKVSVNLGIEVKSLMKGSQICVHPTTGLISHQSAPSQASMWAQGATAIARTIPTDPQVNLLDSIAQSVGVQAIPKMVGATLWREKTKFFRSLGHEYLNLEFGWRPFIQDIMDSMHSVKNSHQIFDDLGRGSGQKTRVGYKFPQSSSFDTAGKGMTIYSVDGTLANQCTQGTNNRYVATTTSDTWFKGCFTYVLPVSRMNMSQSAKYADYANRVLGIGVNEMTPELLWDVAPWSWAVDWAFNYGDVLHNVGALSHDSLTLLYGYIMTHTQKQAVWTAGGNAVVSGLQYTQNYEWKVRYPATPYGFGLSYTGLSLQQKAILAAAGISHW